MRANILLLITAGIWGTTFSAQKFAMQYMGPLTFNAIRFALGSLVLVPLILRMDGQQAGTGKNLRQLVFPGCVLGLLMFIGSYLQQLGICLTTAGKAGFLTGMYVVQVPLLGILMKQKYGPGTWIGTFLAVCGTYFLSVTQDFTINTGDLLVLAGSTFWALHVICIGFFSPGLRTVDAIKMSCLQFIACSIFSLLAALLLETITTSGILASAWPIFYAGFFSVGIAFTLQVVAQRDAQPAAAAIILCTEGIFATLAGWLLLNEIMGARTIAGCLLIFCGMVCSQLKR